MHSGLFLVFFERCRRLDRLQYAATIADTSRVGYKADIAAAAVDIAAAVEGEGYRQVYRRRERLMYQASWTVTTFYDEISP